MVDWASYLVLNQDIANAIGAFPPIERLRQHYQNHGVNESRPYALTSRPSPHAAITAADRETCLRRILATILTPTLPGPEQRVLWLTTQYHPAPMYAQLVVLKWDVSAGTAVCKLVLQNTWVKRFVMNDSGDLKSTLQTLRLHGWVGADPSVPDFITLSMVGWSERWAVGTCESNTGGSGVQQVIASWCSGLASVYSH